MKKIISILIAGIFLFCLLSNAEAFVREVAKKWDAVAVAVDTDWFAEDLGPMKKIFKHLIPFLLAVLITSPAGAITIQGTQGSTMQGGPATMQGGGVTLNPLQIFGSNLISWNDYSSATNLNFGAGTDVESAFDLSGNSNSPSQATVGFRPAFDSVNKWTLSDGVDDYLHLASFTGGAISSPITIFLAYGLASTGIENTVILDGAIGDNARRNSLIIGNLNYKLSAGVTLAGGTLDTEDHIFIGVYNGASSKFFIDGGSAVASGNAGTNDLNGFIIGAEISASSNVHMRVYEHFIVNGLATDDQINQVGKYLSRHDIAFTDVP